MIARDKQALRPGTCLTGKWNGHRYRLIRLLGSGALGTVYLAKGTSKNDDVAVKIAKDPVSLTSEVRMMEKLSLLPGPPLGPSLYDFDDALIAGQKISFCAMEYLRGIPLSEALRIRSFEWAVVCMLQLLKSLERLHKNGYIFGDLKPDNIMFMDTEQAIRCLDFGGVTQIGRSVREYTEFYDRTYWGYGTRKADPEYDLFACAMMLIYAACGHRFEKHEGPAGQMTRLIRSRADLILYEHVLMRAFKGRYHSAGLMRADLLRLAMTGSRKPDRRPAPQVQTHRKKSKRSVAWIAASLTIAAYICYAMVYAM